MPLAHACPACGHALSSVRADYAHDFRAPVVVCPECSCATVRRRHPISSAIRLWWRGAWAVYGLAWRGALAFALVFGTAILSTRIGEELTDAGLTIPEAAAHLSRLSSHDAAWRRLTESGGSKLLVLGVCWTALAGAVLVGGLTHLRRRTLPWSLFLALVLLFIWTPSLYATWEQLERANFHLTSTEALPHAEQATASTHTFLALIPAMLLGSPLGAIARRAILRRDARRFARKRAYLRTRRTAS